MYEEIALEKITAASYNYRRSTDKTADAELAESVRAKGVLEPILVRPMKSNGGYEIVFGNRRFAAATTAGLKKMPCIIKELTDEESLEYQIIENSQRADPNPMDEGLGFKKLIKMGKHTTETLAEKIGHSTAYVLARLKLVKLPKEAQKKLASGEISLGHALLLTRLKNPDDQKTVMERILIHNGITVKEAKNYIKHHYTQRIKEAVFDTKQCETCAFRSKNQTELFPDLKDTDNCMDKSCYFEKTKEYGQAILDEMKKKGFTIIKDEKKIGKLTDYRPKGSCRIYAPGALGLYEGERPRRYKSECMKCFDNHAFYMYTFKPGQYSDPRIMSGEICLDKKCLDKMNKVKGNGSGTAKDDAPSASNPHAIRLKARECRDRFLRATVPEKVDGSEILKKRLTIYKLLLGLGTQREKILIELWPGISKCSGFGYCLSDTEIYRCVEAVAMDKLDNVLDLVLAELIIDENMDTNVLCRIAPSAGIDLAADFIIDKEYLKGKTKGEIHAFTRELKLADVSQTMRKGDMIYTIMENVDLRGKVPKDIAEACDVWPKCNECGKDAGKCGCAVPCPKCGKTGIKCNCVAPPGAG